MAQPTRIDLKNVKDVTPLCPHGKKGVRELLSVLVGGGCWSFSSHSLVLCPHCHVILGYGKVDYA